MEIIIRQRDFLEEALSLERKDRNKLDTELRAIKEEKNQLTLEFHDLKHIINKKDTEISKYIQVSKLSSKINILTRT